MKGAFFSAILLSIFIVSCDDQGDPVSAVPAPSITSVTPDSGKIGDTITVAGTNFGSTQGASSISFGSQNATAIVSWSATQIKAVIPSGVSGGSSTVTVKISGQASNAKSFKILSAVITIVSFSSQVLPMFTTYGCTGCHGGTNNLFVSSYSQLMAGNSTHGPVVVAGDTNSVLILKLKGTASFGVRMPQGGSPMANADLQKIVTWIKEGANNN